MERETCCAIESRWRSSILMSVVSLVRLVYSYQLLDERVCEKVNFCMQDLFSESWRYLINSSSLWAMR